MGYSEIQRHELEETIRRVPCDVVLVATPIDLSRAIRLDKPYVRVRYEVEEIGKPAITELLEQFTDRAQAGAGRGGEVGHVRQKTSFRFVTSRRSRYGTSCMWPAR